MSIKSDNPKRAAVYVLTLPAEELKLGARHLTKHSDLSGLPPGSIEKVIRVAARDRSLLPEIAAGRMTLHQALRRLGMRSGSHPEREARARAKGIGRPPKRKALTADEQTLQACEARIEGNIELFLSLAHDLYTIREQRLYLEHYGEWDRYLRLRWGIPFADFDALTVGINAPIIAQLEETGTNVR